MKPRLLNLAISIALLAIALQGVVVRELLEMVFEGKFKMHRTTMRAFLSLNLLSKLLKQIWIV